MPLLSGKRLLIVEGDRELALLLATEAERMGARVSLCGSGDEALAALQVWPADGAVLDLPLAGTDVRELIAVLRRNAIPAVAVSDAGGGARGAEEAQRLGAQRLLSKPFRVEELLETMVQVLEESPAGAAELEPGAEAGEDLRDFDSLIFSQARPALDEMVPAPLLPVDPEGLARPLPEMARRRAGPPEQGRLLPAGPLARTPLPRLLAVLHAGRATGAVVLQWGAAKKLLLLEDGAVAFAASNAPRERFGPRCVREGILDSAALAAILRGLGPSDTTAGVLLARGMLDPDRRARMVAEQVKEIAWSAFEWREGSYRTLLGPLQPRERVPLALFAGDLILEGMRRFASLPRLREELLAEATLAPAPEPAVEPGRLSLRPGEAEILAWADGTKSIGDLAALSGLGEREALAFLLACRHMGILIEVDPGLASTRRIGFL
jgi:CheY-like chemotaxis protein